MLFDLIILNWLLRISINFDIILYFILSLGWVKFSFY